MYVPEISEVICKFCQNFFSSFVSVFLRMCVKQIADGMYVYMYVLTIVRSDVSVSLVSVFINVRVSFSGYCFYKRMIFLCIYIYIYIYICIDVYM
jgi:hypothetical protein